MAVFFVESNQVVEVNGIDYNYPNNPNGIQRQIPCQNVEIVNSYWKIPIMQLGRIIGYDILVADGSLKPTPDSLKILRVKDRSDNTEYGFAIADTDNIFSSSPSNQFAYLCDGLGGTLPVMPTVTIPVPIIQNGPQTTASNGSNTFVFSFPTNGGGLLYSIPYPWFNGVAPATPYAPSGITTVAQFVTWANSHWGTYGTWAQIGSTNTVSLVSATGSGVYVNFAGMQIDLTPASFCLTLSTAQNVNGINIGGQVLPIAPMAVSSANVLAVWNAIQGYMPGTTPSFSVSGKLGLSTIQNPIALTFNGVTVSGLTFAGGSC